MTPLQDYCKQMGICSKHRDLPKAMDLFREKSKADVCANLGIYNSLLFLCCEESSIELRTSASNEILHDMTERQVKYDETAFSNAIRLTSMSGNVKKAMELLQHMRADSKVPKRRTYAPIFQYHPANTSTDLYSMNSIYLESEKDEVECTEEELHSMLKACVRVQLEEQKGAGEPAAAATLDVLSPLEFFRLTVHRMKDLVPYVSLTTLETLRNWCSSTTTSTTSTSTTSTTSTTPSISTSTTSTLHTTTIDQTTCQCAHCHLQLQSIDLTVQQNDTILLQIAQVLAADATGMFQQHFDRYSHWIQKTHPQGIEVVIDGANVGFFGRRPPKESLSFQQIDRVIRAFTDCPDKKDRKKVLLILHQRHFKRLSRSDQQLVDGWKRARFLYQTPHRMNDDWFWLYIAVWSSRFVAQPFVVTNDQMRDHHFQMLSR